METRGDCTVCKVDFVKLARQMGVCVSKAAAPFR